MNTITKEALLAKYPVESGCTVTYKDGKTTKKVEYSSLKNINWKNAIKITVLFAKPKLYMENGDGHTRKGAAYLLV